MVFPKEPEQGKYVCRHHFKSVLAVLVSAVRQGKKKKADWSVRSKTE